MNDKFSNIGRMCPLCKKGVFLYIHIDEKTSLFGARRREYVTCSNKKCDANIKWGG